MSQNPVTYFYCMDVFLSTYIHGFMGRVPQLNNRRGKKTNLMCYFDMLVLAESEVFPYYRSIQGRPQMTVMKGEPSSEQSTLSFTCGEMSLSTYI